MRNRMRDFAQRRTLRAGGAGVLAEDVREPGARHVAAAGIEKELRDGCRAANGEPGAEGVADLLPQQKRALLAPLAAHADLDIPPVEAHVVEVQADELGDPQPAGEAQVEHGAVTNPEARRGVRRVEDGTGVRRRQMPHQARVGAVYGDGEDAADLVERGRDAVLEKAHEGADGGEPRVAGAGTVAPFVLKMVEEREHEGRVEIRIESLRRHGLPFSALCVVSAPLPGLATRLYEYFGELGCDVLDRLTFNPREAIAHLAVARRSESAPPA